MQQVPQLEGLQDRALGHFTLQVQCAPRRRVGHFDIDIFLKDNEGKLSCEPIVTGIYSKGNPSSRIFGWLDIHYLDCFAFDNGDAGVLSGQDSLAEGLFEILGNCIPPGGMIMCSYITDMAWGFESPLHEVTRRCLQVHSLEISPAATPLGRLLVAAGCRNIKAGAYDVQGSSRLAGEKALDGEYEKRFTQRLIEQLEEYLGRDHNPEYKDIEDICRSNAANIMRQMIM
ncbi:MAG: hypothetical protein JXA50_04505 [Deltaproteobacteria bacterium]|nr:hypothetical protein [Deltaproteobacteria bacterium]